MKILDLTAGNRAIWFNKEHPLAVYVDRRSEVKPTIVADNTALPPEIGKDFDLVVFDPPHKNCGPNSNMSRVYGYHTTEEILRMVQGAAKEAYRVTGSGGLMALKWNSSDIRLSRILDLMPQWEPLFGHLTKDGPRSQTYWVMLKKVEVMKKHSKFSASGAERWFRCPGSVKLSEGMPDKSSVWAEEGTKAHEVLEKIIKALNPHLYGTNNAWIKHELPKLYSREMVQHAINAATFIRNLESKTCGELKVETRIHLDFIHPEMFGTFDSAIIDYFDTLHIFDYKYGAGHAVSPVENLQMIFYGIGMAHKYNWNFKKVRLWIIQPRIKGYDGPVFWDVSISALKGHWQKTFKDAVQNVEKNPNQFNEGPHCHWCKAKSVCPLKRETKLELAKNLFDKTSSQSDNNF